MNFAEFLEFIEMFVATLNVSVDEKMKIANKLLDNLVEEIDIGRLIEVLEEVKK